MQLLCLFGRFIVNDLAAWAPPLHLTDLKWMVQRHKDVYQNSRLRLEYAYVLFNKFMMNRITSELVKIGQILTSFSVTESTCDDSF